MSPSLGAGPGSTAVVPERLSRMALSPSGPPRTREKPAGPAYTLSRVMPSAWSWYHSVDSRWSLGYWKMANPGPHATPNFDAALPPKKSYQVPSTLFRSARVRQVPGLGVAVALVADPG